MWSVAIPALSDFLVKNSEVQFEMTTREQNELPELLWSGKADFVCACSLVDHPDIECVPLGEECNVLVESKDGSKRSNTYLDHDSNDHTTLNFLKHQGKKI